MLANRRRSADRRRVRSGLRYGLFAAVFASILLAADQPSRLQAFWELPNSLLGGSEAEHIEAVSLAAIEPSGSHSLESPVAPVAEPNGGPEGATIEPAELPADGAVAVEADASISDEPATLPAPEIADEVLVDLTVDEEAATESATPEMEAASLPSGLPSVFDFDALDSGREPGKSRSQRVIAVRRGDTLMDILLSIGMSRAEAHEAVSALATVYDPRALKPGQEITFTFATGDGQPIVGAWLAARADRDVGLTREPGGRFVAQQRDKALTLEPMRAAGMVTSSLYEAGLSAGVPIQIMTELIRAFSFDIDFQREIQPGDAFEILFERFRGEDGRVAKEGALRYATLLLSGRRMAIYRYVDRDGNVDYYNEKGESVRKALLKTPIDGARLTSGFGSRMHPILGYSAFHKGVDFGAATGTPIQAAGDGIVEMRGWFGGYGNYVRIRHNGEYSTAYAHLSKFGNGITEGARVRQGQIIGYVGSTGRSTGPHLHYEVLRRGAQINPMGVKFPTGRKLEGGDLVQFKHARGDIDHWLTNAQTAVSVAVRPPEPRPVD
jgi:murein DD-endopeptidase MepM/ murein hydrolase activator NlpD